MLLKKFFLFFILLITPLQTFASEDLGYFTTIHPNFPVTGYKITKLDDGRLLFGIQTIFDPKTNTFHKTKYYDSEIKFSPDILLNDGRVMIFSPEYDSLPTSRLILNRDFKRQIEAKNSYTFMNQYEKEEAKRKFWENYYNLTENERAEIYTPIIKDNPEFQAIYNKAVKEYNNSKYIRIYDPKTDELIISAKSNSEFGRPQTLLLQDGKVFVVYNIKPKLSDSTAYEYITSEIELFNPKDGTITSIKNTFGYELKMPHLLSDGRVLLQTPKGEIVTFNPKDNSFFKSKHKINGKIYNLEDGRVFSSFGSSMEGVYYVAVYDPKNGSMQKFSLGFNRFYKLNSGKILIFHLDNRRNMLASIFDPKTNKIIPSGRLKTFRGTGQDVLLKNDNILMYNGINYKRSGYFVGTIDENRIELFNPNTGKSTILNTDIKKAEGFYHCTQPVVLDDGRVFLGINNNNDAIIYVP